MDWHQFMAEAEKEIGTLGREIPATAKGYGMMGSAAKTNGALDEKTKEFIALGIAVTTRCLSCIGFHTRSLVRLGATREEFCEALAMTTYMGAGPSYTYSAKALSAFDAFSGGPK